MTLEDSIENKSKYKIRTSNISMLDKTEFTVISRQFKGKAKLGKVNELLSGR